MQWNMSDKKYTWMKTTWLRSQSINSGEPKLIFEEIHIYCQGEPEFIHLSYFDHIIFSRCINSIFWFRDLAWDGEIKECIALESKKTRELQIINQLVIMWGLSLASLWVWVMGQTFPCGLDCLRSLTPLRPTSVLSWR